VKTRHFDRCASGKGEEMTYGQTWTEDETRRLKLLKEKKSAYNQLQIPGVRSVAVKACYLKLSSGWRRNTNECTPVRKQSRQTLIENSKALRVLN
jgi:hypothetical protein